ncbi:MAG: glycosyltransferase family 4 protein [Actinomycetota bacterium]|nr:glycosyltransferase family 4 protein [Actinomycetota bacterium]
MGHYASERNGGEGSIPLRLFDRLRARGVPTWLLTHSSARAELTSLLPPAELARVTFSPGVPGFGPVFTWGERLPTGPRTIAWAITQLERQAAMVPVARRLVRDLAIDVVHQPISVSPIIPSPLTRLGAPVVMGPLNGGMAMPPAFRDRDSALNGFAKAIRPTVAATANQLVRGRRKAAAVLVANDRTRSLLPKSARRRALDFSDIGIVLDSWAFTGEQQPPMDETPAGPARFLFTGRLVALKGVDILLDAFALVRQQIPARLEIVGDGPEQDKLVEQAARIAGGTDVSFPGWLAPAECARRMQACDVFVSPSLQEAGGVAVLEAMACARPVIVTAWGGHLSTVDSSTGILVGVASRDTLVRELADAMIRLAGDRPLRFRLGEAGRRRVAAQYDWDVLVDRLLDIYDQVSASPQGGPLQPTAARL